MAAISTTYWMMLLTVTVTSSLIPVSHPLREIEVLELLKETFSDPLSVFATWSRSQPNFPCSWKGVTCATEGHVIVINLSNSKLGGEIPPEIGQLSALRELYLQGNSLTRSLPVALGDLQALQMLDLSSNQLSGKIPSSLEDLPNLNKADLSNNLDLCWDFTPTSKFVGSYKHC